MTDTPRWDPDPTHIPIVPGVPQPPPPAPVPYYPPQSAPPAGYYQQPYYYGPPQPQVVTKPGGLSSTAHVVHIILCFLTCGVWIPGYVLIWLFAPQRRTEVIVPVGADPQAVRQAYASTDLTPEERRIHNRKVLYLGIALAALFVACVLGFSIPAYR